MDTSGPDDAPQSEFAPGGRFETRLDLLLAEELQVNPDFARWFASGAFPTSATVPDPVVRFNVWDEGGPPTLGPGEAGENDLDVTFRFAGGPTIRLLIEDKVWAPFQPDQGRRYQARARSRPDTKAILVAPATRLAGDDTESRYFDKAWRIEEIADFLADQADSLDQSAPLASRLRWHVKLLRDLCTRSPLSLAPDHPPMVALKQFCLDWLTREAPEAVVSPRVMRARNSGWLRFQQPKGLIYKIIHGFVDLYVAERGLAGTLEDLQEMVDAGATPAGFVAATDSGNNIVLRWVGKPILAGEGVPADTGALIEGLEACALAVRWVAGQPEGFGSVSVREPAAHRLGIGLGGLAVALLVHVDASRGLQRCSCRVLGRYGGSMTDGNRSPHIAVKRSGCPVWNTFGVCAPGLGRSRNERLGALKTDRAESVGKARTS